ncbi:MAG: hypothetical protein V4760_09365 [Bdellovibrionota bacterium]
MKFATMHGFTKDLWVVDAVTVIAVLIATSFGPWWSFALVAWVAGFHRSRKGVATALPAAICAVSAWLMLAFAKDAYNGFRVSARIGGFLGLPHGSIVYVAVAGIAYLVAIFAAASGGELGRLYGPKAAR